MRTVKLSDESEVKTLFAIIQKNFGLKERDIKSSSRKELLVITRQVISNIARIENNTHPEIIGSILNKDRTSIISYWKKHDQYLKSWPVYKNTFERIYTDYCRLKDKRQLFSSEQELRSYLFNVGVKFSEKPSIFITVKMKDFVVCINTDYRNFSFNSELIRLALIDYDCQIEINFENETCIK